MYTRIRRSALLSALLIIAATSSADASAGTGASSATGTSDRPPSPPDVEPRSPRAIFRLHPVSGTVDTFGVSLTLTRTRPFELEAGAAVSGAVAMAVTAYARAGVAIAILDRRRPEGSGWTMHTEGLVGYRYLHTAFISDYTASFRGITAVAGIDATRHFRSGMGLDFQLLGGVFYGWGKESDWGETRPVQRAFPELRLSIGLAF